MTHTFTQQMEHLHTHTSHFPILPPSISLYLFYYTGIWEHTPSPYLSGKTTWKERGGGCGEASHLSPIHLEGEASLPVSHPTFYLSLLTPLFPSHTSHLTTVLGGKACACMTTYTHTHTYTPGGPWRPCHTHYIHTVTGGTTYTSLFLGGGRGKPGNLLPYLYTISPTILPSSYYMYIYISLYLPLYILHLD